MIFGGVVGNQAGKFIKILQMPRINLFIAVTKSADLILFPLKIIANNFPSFLVFSFFTGKLFYLRIFSPVKVSITIYLELWLSKISDYT